MSAMPSLEELTGRIDALERRVRRAEDFDELLNLKSRYGALADSRYTLEGVVARDELERIARELSLLFSEDAVWDGGARLGVAQGREAIYQRFLDPTLTFTWHYFVKPRIDVDGDRAQGSWDILAPCISADGRALWMAGYEEDEYARVAGRWLHTRMKLTVVFMASYERGWVPKRSDP